MHLGKVARGQRRVSESERESGGRGWVSEEEEECEAESRCEGTEGEGVGAEAGS